jgi:hypothetical protein
MAEVVLFHHALGLTLGVVAFADELRRAGRTVHTPDLFQGRTFDSIEAGMGYAGGDRLPRRGPPARRPSRRGTARRPGVRRLLTRRRAGPDAGADAAATALLTERVLAFLAAR